MRHWTRYARARVDSALVAPVIAPGTPQHRVEFVLADFMKYLIDGDTCKASADTIVGYVTGVVQGHFDAGVDIVLDTHCWKRTTDGARNHGAAHHQPKPKKVRMPIGADIVKRLQTQLDSHNESPWLRAAASFAYNGFLRKCEFLPYSVRTFDPKHDPTVSDIGFKINGVWVSAQDATWTQTMRLRRRSGRGRSAEMPTHMVYRCKHTKRGGAVANQRQYRNVPIYYQDDALGTVETAVADMWSYMCDRNEERARRGDGTMDPDAPLFVYANSDSPVGYTRFNATLKICLAAIGEQPRNFASHSFRHGAASDEIYRGATEEEVRRLGRWAMGSTALAVYVHRATHDVSERARRAHALIRAPEYLQDVLAALKFAAVGPDPRRT